MTKKKGHHEEETTDEGAGIGVLDGAAVGKRQACTGAQSVSRARKEGNRCCRTNAFFTRAEYELVKAAAKDRELSMSEFLRRSALERVKVQTTRRASECGHATPAQIEALRTARERRTPLAEMPDHCAKCGMPHEGFEEWEEETHP